MLQQYYHLFVQDIGASDNFYSCLAPVAVYPWMHTGHGRKILIREGL